MALVKCARDWYILDLWLVLNIARFFVQSYLVFDMRYTSGFQEEQQPMMTCSLPGMVFVEVWMILITVVQTDSVDKKQEIKARTPFLYPAQKMAQAHLEACDDLVAAEFFEQTLTLDILESFLLANGKIPPRVFAELSVDPVCSSC